MKPPRLTEDVPTMSAGSGQIAGIGVGPQGEPGVDMTQRRKKRKKEASQSPSINMKADELTINDMLDELKSIDEDLRKWFGQGKTGGVGGGGWDRYNTKGERIGKCGDAEDRGGDSEGKPKCLSKEKAAQLRAQGGAKAIANAVKRKKDQDPVTNRKGTGGAPRPVSNRIGEASFNLQKKSLLQNIDHLTSTGANLLVKKLFGDNYFADEINGRKRILKRLSSWASPVKVASGSSWKDAISQIAGQKYPLFTELDLDTTTSSLQEKNVPTDPELWSRAKAEAKKRFDVYPSAYANGWASKWYKEKGGGWKSESNEANTPLTELTDRPLPWRQTVSLSDHLEAQFTAPNRTDVYKVHLWGTKFRPPQPRTIRPGIPAPPIYKFPIEWEFGFARYTSSAWDASGNDSVVGDTDAEFKIFSTVIDIMKSFFRQAHPMMVHFAAKEPSRARLYSRFIPRVASLLPGYVGKEVRPGHYVIRNIKATNEDNTPSDREWGTDSLVRIYKQDTPGELAEATALVELISLSEAWEKITTCQQCKKKLSPREQKLGFRICDKCVKDNKGGVWGKDSDDDYVDEDCGCEKSSVKEALAQDPLSEAAEYQGRKVTLGKPFRTPDGPKKFSVYVKNDKGNVVKVNFGDPKMEIKRDDPDRRKNFRARHNCDNPGPRWKAQYWSCRFWSKAAVSKLT